MSRRRTPAAVSGFTRRWHIPPPLVHGPEPLEGGAVLGEVPGPMGLLLWQAHRDVLLWAEAASPERGGLFAPSAAALRDRVAASAALDDTLLAPLAVLRTLLHAPGSVDAGEVAEACAVIAGWADDRGFPATALAFHQNGALAEPTRPAPALAVARVASRLGDHARAELWYRRATGIARRARAWRIYARSFSGLGTLYQDRGNLPAAQRFHLRALRGARRGGLRAEQAAALHDLFGVAVEAGRGRDAERYAREAIEAYSRRSPRLAALAHDVAYFWMEEGHFARALAVFEAVAPLVHGPAERLWVQADLMRAAAGTGNAALAERAAREVRHQCEVEELAPASARALLEVARGELQLGHWDAATQAAREALRRAREHREGRTALAAEALLGAIDSGRAAGSRAAGPARRSGDTPGKNDDALAADLIRSLREMASEAPGGSSDVDTMTMSSVNHESEPEARPH